MTVDLWSLVSSQRWIDPRQLAVAINQRASAGPMDFRTRLLVRDSTLALRERWGGPAFDSWLANVGAAKRIHSILEEDLGRTGFPFLSEQLVEPLDCEKVRQLFREVGRELPQRTVIYVGGSVSLMMNGCLARSTQDIDIVDEVPKQIRELRNLADIERRFRLKVSHFQSHYLPSGWQNRVRGLEPFDNLQPYLVDPYDVFLGKLTSVREKDKDDLLELAKSLDKERLVRLFRTSMASTLAAPSIHDRCKRNWFILFGEELPQ